MKWLYKIVLGLLGFLLLSSLTLWILSKTIKAETIRQYLNTQLTQLTSQRILIEGEVNWKLLPRPAIKITHLTAGENNTQAPYKIHVDNLLLNLKIGPLLHGQLLFHELKINGLTARINTALLSQENPRLTTEKVEHLSQLLPEQLAIDQVMITRGTLILIKDNQELRISNLQLGAKPFNLLQNAFPFQFKGKIKLTGNNAPLFNATINFNGNTLTNKSHKITRPPLFLGLTGIKGQLTLTHANIESLHIDKLSASTLVTKPMIQLNPITLALYHGEATGSLKYDIANQTLTLNQTATNLDATALFDALIHKKLIQGNLDFTVHSQTNLQTNAWPNNTQADGTMTIRKGVLLAFNLNRVIDEISNKITRLLQKERGSAASNANTKSNANSFQLDSFDNASIFQGNTPLKLLTISYQLQNGNL